MKRKREYGSGGLLKRPGCDNWVAQWRVGEQVYRRSTGESDKDAAQKKLTVFMADSIRGLDPAEKGLCYADLREGLINSYRREHCKSLIETDDGEETIRALEPLDRFAGFSKTSRGIPVAKITTKWAEKFVEQRLAEGTGDAWINRSLSALIRGLNLLCERGKISVVPKIYKQAEPPARQGYIEQPAFEKLLAESPSHLKPTISMLYYTGVRKGELLAIDWSQVDLKERIIMLGEIDTKTGEPRTLPIPSDVLAWMRTFTPKRGPVFSGEGLRYQWEEACTRVGLGKRVTKRSDAGNLYHEYHGLRLHDLRRSAVRNLIRSGVPQATCMAISGHKTDDVFRRYNIIDTTDIVQAMRAVELRAAKAKPIGVQPSSRPALSGIGDQIGVHTLAKRGKAHEYRTGP
ncbi:MAG: tyrosine-type recombinase/integrase [Terriglobales bacterium]